MKLKKSLAWCLGLSIFFFVCGCAKIETEETEDYVGQYSVKSGWSEANDYPLKMILETKITKLRMLGFFNEHLLKKYDVDNGYFVFVWKYGKKTNISRLPIDKITAITIKDHSYPTIKFKFNINSILEKQKTEEDEPKHFINSKCVVSATIMMTEEYMEENPILNLK